MYAVIVMLPISMSLNFKGSRSALRKGAQNGQYQDLMSAASTELSFPNARWMDAHPMQFGAPRRGARNFAFVMVQGRRDAATMDAPAMPCRTGYAFFTVQGRRYAAIMDATAKPRRVGYAFNTVQGRRDAATMDAPAKPR